MHILLEPFRLGIFVSFDFTSFTRLLTFWKIDKLFSLSLITMCLLKTHVVGRVMFVALMCPLLYLALVLADHSPGLLSRICETGM